MYVSNIIQTELYLIWNIKNYLYEKILFKKKIKILYRYSIILLIFQVIIWIKKFSNVEYILKNKYLNEIKMILLKNVFLQSSKLVYKIFDSKNNTMYIHILINNIKRYSHMLYIAIVENYNSLNVYY